MLLEQAFQRRAAHGGKKAQPLGGAARLGLGHGTVDAMGVVMAAETDRVG